MKKIIIVIGIVIAVFVVWFIVDQSGLVLLYWDLGPWSKDNRGYKDMRYDGPEQLQNVLDHCAFQRLAEAQNYTASDGTVMIVDAIGFNYENSTHHIDNADCEWHEKPVFTGIRLLPGNTDDIRLNEVLDSCACWGGFGEAACKLSSFGWSNETHHIDNNTCEWEESVWIPYRDMPAKCESGPSPNDEFYYYDEELCELIPKDIDLK